MILIVLGVIVYFVRNKTFSNELLKSDMYKYIEYEKY